MNRQTALETARVLKAMATLLENYVAPQQVFGRGIAEAKDPALKAAVQATWRELEGAGLGTTPETQDFFGPLWVELCEAGRLDGVPLSHLGLYSAYITLGHTIPQQSDPKRERLRQQLLFFERLRILLSARRPIPTALSALSRDAEDAGYREAVKSMAAAVERGETLGSVLRSFPALFDSEQGTAIEGGETQGRLEEILRSLTAGLARRLSVST